MKTMDRIFLSHPVFTSWRPIMIGTVLLLLLCAWYYPFAYSDQPAGILADDAMYLLMADFFSGRFPGDTVLLQYVMQETYFPPLFPFILALLGANSTHIVLAHGVSVTLFLAAMGMLFVIARQMTHRTSIAVWCVLVMAIAPASLFLATEIWSEFLFMLLVFLALWLVERETASTTHWLLVAALVAFATLARSAGIALVAAFILTLFPARRQPRFVLALIALIPMLGWWALVSAGSPNHDSYIEVFLRRSTGHSVWDLLSGYANMVASLWKGWVHSFALQHSVVAVIVCGAVLVLGLWGMIGRLRQLKLDALYTAFSLCMLIVWPFPHVAGRLLYPLIPLLLLYSTLPFATNDPEGKGANRYAAWGRLLPLLAMVAISLPSTFHIGERYLRPGDPLVGEFKNSRYWLRATDDQKALTDILAKRAFINAMRKSESLVPSNDCIYSIHTQIVMLHSRRISIPPPPPDNGREALLCHYQFIIVDDKLAGNSIPTLQTNYRIVHKERERLPNGTERIAAILLHYPEE